MSAVADKARFYLERAVPQLREFEEKAIFSRDEIRTLVAKRSDFEHLVLAPRSSPDDFLSYAAWEQSLEALRAKRCRRRRVASSTSSRPGQARTFQILERAAARHPGSLAVWLAYLDYAARVGATKRWRKVAARALRLHPGDAALWVLAGRRASRSGDMESARGYFMRGCRFCTKDAGLWVEYARAEMEWLGRVEARTKRGKLSAKSLSAAEEVQKEEVEAEGDMIALEDDESDDSGDEDEGGAKVMIPGDAPRQKQQPKEIFSEEAAEKLEKSPALGGAIPMAIFDISKKQPFFNAAAAEAFFDMLAEFSHVSVQPKIIQHILDAMVELYPTNAATCSCIIRQPVIGIDPHTPEFPQALREALARLRVQQEKTDNKQLLASKVTAWIDTLLAVEDLDTALRTVLEHTKRKLENP